MSHVIKLTVTVTLERTEGKFASRDEMTEALVEMIENANEGSISGLGADYSSEYEISEWEVEA